MAFILNSKVQIGSYSFTGGINELRIRKSVHCIVDTATLKIPGLATVYKEGQNANMPATSVQTAKLFQEGDKVAIDLGYNGDMRNEFRGFVRRVNLTTPITIELEGYAWQLRNNNILASWKITTVREVLERVIAGTDIVLSPDIPQIALTSFYIKNRSGLDVLDYLKDKMLLTVYFDDNMLYAGLEEGRTTEPGTIDGLAEVKYNIGFNCISNQTDLKQRLGKDNKVRVRLRTKGKNGKHVLYEAGDEGGAIYDRIIPFSNDVNYLRSQADAFLKRLKYDGYEGKIRGFLQPFAKPGYKATLTDKNYDGVRAGTYFVPGTEVIYGVRGAQRITEITYRLDG